MRMSVLFLSHNPHEVHLNFARAVGARVEVLPFDESVRRGKHHPAFKLLHPLQSFLYSKKLKVKEDVLLVDGGSSIFTAAFLKMRYKHLKLVYIDGDLFILTLSKNNFLTKIVKKFFLKRIDAIISVSEMNKDEASKYLTVPIEVAEPYPQPVCQNKNGRKNYGLYVGRLDPDKNIDRIIDFGLNSPFLEKFIVVGEGTLSDYIKEKASVNKKLVYVGETGNISKYYSECKFLVHLPDFDPHPCTTMEAAECGCYPLISEGVGSKYLFDEMFIVNANDFDEVNDKIDYILKHDVEVKKSLEKTVEKIPSKSDSIKKFKLKFDTVMGEIT